MEEFNERVHTAGVSAARRWYWQAILRNMIALAVGGKMTGKAHPRTLFLISGIWFSIALLWIWFSRGWLKGLEHQAWGLMTVVVFLAYFVLVVGWLVPLLWALIRLVPRSRMRGKPVR